MSTLVDPTPAMPYLIRSTYAERAPEYDTHPQARQWPGEYEDYAQAWIAVESHLLLAGWKRRWSCRGLTPYGHTEPTARYGDTTIRNDAETITILPHSP